MIQQIVDLHIHSKYSRACSKYLDLPTIAQACEIRGIDIVVTGDMTHPLWFAHIEQELIEVAEGIYQLSGNRSRTKFIIGTEVSVIKKDKGKTRRVHHCLYAPTIAVAKKLNQQLEQDGYNLKADGRPILGMTSQELLHYVLEIDERIQLIPAHAWTPWFGVFGSKGGYDSLEDAFGDMAHHVRAIETGLSSDPIMNRMCSWLDDITLVSNSDAHSPQKLGREANVLAFNKKEDITFSTIFKIINSGDKKHFLSTIEFFPEEGKYFFDGHADCTFSSSPKETKSLNEKCRICNKKMTIGVLNRVYQISDRTEKEVKILFDSKKYIPFKKIVPLTEIISSVMHKGIETKAVQKEYQLLIQIFGNEFRVLEQVSISEINKISYPGIGTAILNMRNNLVTCIPGYDGLFGTIRVV
jgi:uncharacterized protein (TIGR00375 family)